MSLFLASLAFCPGVLAHTNSLDWHTIDGGGSLHANLVNNGTVNATFANPLRLRTGTKTNNGTVS